MIFTGRTLADEPIADAHRTVNQVCLGHRSETAADAQAAA
jgi:hypothetical protein